MKHCYWREKMKRSNLQDLVIEIEIARHYLADAERHLRKIPKRTLHEMYMGMKKDVSPIIMDQLWRVIYKIRKAKGIGYHEIKRHKVWIMENKHLPCMD